MTAIENYEAVLADIHKAEAETGRKSDSVKLVAVSKTYDEAAIRPIIETGQKIFGENRVQEAYGKWPVLKAENDEIELHLIGPLQSNKAEEAVKLFDAIQSIDREKIARAISKEMIKQKKSLKLFVQVNTGLEEQKSGVKPSEVEVFIKFCQNELNLGICGLMCIPPVNENPGPHFALLKKLANECGLSEISCGMSGDYETAIMMGATYVRVGSAIFGQRN